MTYLKGRAVTCLSQGHTASTYGKKSFLCSAGRQAEWGPLVLTTMKRSRLSSPFTPEKTKARERSSFPSPACCSLARNTVLSPLHPICCLGPFPNWGANSCPWRALGMKQLQEGNWPRDSPAGFMSRPGRTVWLLYERLSRAQRWNLF